MICHMFKIVSALRIYMCVVYIYIYTYSAWAACAFVCAHVSSISSPCSSYITIGKAWFLLQVKNEGKTFPTQYSAIIFLPIADLRWLLLDTFAALREIFFA